MLLSLDDRWLCLMLVVVECWFSAGGSGDVGAAAVINCM